MVEDTRVASFHGAHYIICLLTYELINNPFWMNVRSLLTDLSEPVHVVFAIREDGQDGLHCFEFAEQRVYRLPRLEKQDALVLVDALTLGDSIRNRENGFEQIVRIIVDELARDSGAILPIQLRMTLAGLGQLTGSLTPKRIEHLGGVSALGGIYLESALQPVPEAWPVVNALASRSTDGRIKATTLATDDLSILVPGSSGPAVLEYLAGKRIIRCVNDVSGRERWQLYHDYLAGAVVALDGRRRRLSVLLEDSARRYGHANGIIQKWKNLLPFTIQTQLLWRRLRDGSFRYGEYSWYAQLSILRVLLNLWMVVLISGPWLLMSWFDRRDALEVVKSFQQGYGHERDHNRALWRLARGYNDHFGGIVIDEFFSSEMMARTFSENSDSILAAFGLHARAFDKFRLLTVDRGPCVPPSREFQTLEACSYIRRLLASATTGTTQTSPAQPLSSDPSSEALLIIDHLREEDSTTNVYLENDLLERLSRIADGLNESTCEPIERRIEDRLAGSDSLQINALAGAVSAISEKLSSTSAERLFNRILDRITTIKDEDFAVAALSKSAADLIPRLENGSIAKARVRVRSLMHQGDFQALSLGKMLTALVKNIPRPDADRLAPVMVEQLAVAGGTEAEYLGEAIGVTAPKVSGELRDALAFRIIELMGRGSGVRGDDLGAALRHLTGGDRKKVEVFINRIIDRMSGVSEFGAEEFGAALTELANDNISEDQAERATQKLLDKMNKNSGLGAGYVASSLKALAVRAKPDTPGRVVAESFSKLQEDVASGKSDELEAAWLCDVIAELSSKVKGDYAERSAELALQVMKRDPVADPKYVAESFARLLSLVRQDKLERLLTSFLEEYVSMPCGKAIENSQSRELMVDMLKWPVCSDRGAIMLRLARVQGTDPSQLGDLDSDEGEEVFNPDWIRVIAWLRTQKDESGRDFDIDGPPRRSPIQQRR